MSRLLLAARFLYGTILLLSPTRALGRLARAPVDRRTAVAARVLGARELVQAELVRRHPGRRAQLISAGVDGLHAATMFGLAAADRDRRTLALHNGATAGALALAGLAAARSE
jgi:hypothetical protein